MSPSPERLVFPTAKDQKGFENWVGLENGYHSARTGRIQVKHEYGITIPPLDKKLDLYDGQNKKKLERWVELCRNCHSGRFARLWFEALDEYMFAAYRKRDEAQFLVEECFEKGWIDVKNRGLAEV